MSTYARTDLAADLAKQMECSVDKAKATVECVLAAIQGALVAGRKVEFRGFGILEPVRQKEKIGRNPRDPKVTYHIPARTVVKFRTGAELSSILNSQGAVALKTCLV